MSTYDNDFGLNINCNFLMLAGQEQPAPVYPTEQVFYVRTLFVPFGGATIPLNSNLKKIMKGAL